MSQITHTTHSPQQAQNTLAGHLIVQCLIAQGVTHAFGVPGESFLAVLDGFHAHADQIQFIINRQEGGAAFMAEAQGKLTNRPGICFVTRGPGATNASIGVHTAFQDSTPMILFVGDVDSGTRDREPFQELDFSAFFGPNTKGMAKRVERIDDARRIPETIARAFASAMNGRPGPVVIVLPEDMLVQTVAAQHATPVPRLEPVATGISAAQLSQVAQLLSAAKRPIVIAGGGGWTPAAALALGKFAENWQLPVGNAFRFQDTFDNHHPNYAGDVGIGINSKLAARIKNADLILCIGARLGEMTTGGYTLLALPCPTQTLIHIHASAEELNRVYQADLAICASMAWAAIDLATLEPQFAGTIAPWSENTLSANADYVENLVPQPLPGDIDMPAIIASVQKHLPHNAAVTNGAGNFASWMHRFFKHYGLARGVKTQLAPTSGAMGYGVPAGIAVGILSKDAQGVQHRLGFTIAGDGDFMMNGQELATAVQYGVKSIIVILNNGILGTIRMHQEREYPAHISGTTLKNPDFVKLAHAYGYAAERVTHTAQFEPAFLAALARAEGTVIEVMLDPEVITTRGTLSGIEKRLCG